MKPISAEPHPHLLTLSLLGTPRLLLDGQSVSRWVKYRKAWALWALLGTTRGQTHARAMLAQWLWPDLEAPAAKANLRQVIGNLRAVISRAGLPHYLVCSGHALGLKEGPHLAVDVEQLRTWAGACTSSETRSGSAALSVDGAPDFAEGARFLEGWHLPLMPDGRDWLLHMREMCGDWVLQRLEFQARRAESEGRLTEAVAYARRLQALSPMQENHAILLADLLQRQGQQTQASEVVRRTMQAIKHHLGVEAMELAERDSHVVSLGFLARQSGLAQEWRWVTALYAEVPTDVGTDDQAAGAMQRIWGAMVERARGMVVQVPGLAWAAVFGMSDASQEPGRFAWQVARDWMERIRLADGRCGLSEAKVLVRPALAPIVPAGEAVRSAMRVCWQGAPGGLLATATVVQQSGEQGFVAVEGDSQAAPLYTWKGRESSQALARNAWRGEQPLVGRENELQRLQACWRRALQGEMACVLVRAPAGYGKTRLVQALAEKIEAKEIDKLAVVCSWDIQEQSLMPWLLALKLGDEPMQKEGRQGSRRQIWDRLRGLVAERPLLVWIEDLHWADQATLDYLPILVQHLKKSPVMLVMTTRPLLDGQPLPFAETLDLGGLAPEDADQLLQLRADGTPYSVDERRRLIQSAGGVPLLLQWLNRSPPRQADPGIQTLVQAQLDALGPGRVVLRAASVLGVRFSRALLQTLLPTHACQAVLVRATRLHLVRAIGNDDWAFQHSLIQEVAYACTPPAVREAWHAEAAAHLQTLDHATPELLARHWQAARQWRDAARCWRHAGDLAMERDFAADALVCFEKALDAMQQTTAPPGDLLQKAAVQIQVGHCLHMAEGFGSARAWSLFSEVEESLQTMSADAPLVQDLRFATTAGRYMGSSSQGLVDGIDLAQRLSGMARTDEQRLMACYAMGNTLFWLGRLKESRCALEEAIALSNRLSVHHRLLYCTDDPAVVCRAFLSWVCWYLGDETEHTRWMQEAHGLLVPEQRPHTICYALTLLACAHWCQGKWELMQSEAVQVQTLAQQFSFPLWEGVGRLLLICHQAQQGQLQNLDALRTAAQQMSGAYQAGITTSRWMAAYALMSQGLHAQAIPLLEQACDEALHHEDQYCVPQMLHLLAQCQDQAGEPALARSLEEQAFTGARSMGANGLLQLWGEVGVRSY